MASVDASVDLSEFSIEELGELDQIRKDFYVSRRPLTELDNNDTFSRFSHLRSVEDIVDTEERSKQERIKTIQLYERFQEMSLRESVSKSLSPEMLARQLSDIDEAYAETNYLRAELAELAANKTIFTVKKAAIPKFIYVALKERGAHQAYASAARKAAAADAKTQLSNIEWKRRVLCDNNMVSECKRLMNEANQKKSLVLKKRRKFDLHRAKAILRADLEALQSAWPSGDYAALLSGSDLLEASAPHSVVA